MNELMKVEKVNGITSLELVKEVNIFREQDVDKKYVELQHCDLLKIIRNEFDEEISLGNISESEYLNVRGKKYPMFNLTYQQAKQVLMRESKFVRKATVKYIENLENQLQAVTNKKLLLADLFDTDKMVVVGAYKKLVEIETKPLVDKLEEQAPKVEVYDSFNNGWYDMREVVNLVKIKGLGRNKLYSFLRHTKMVGKNNIPYQRWEKVLRQVPTSKIDYFGNTVLKTVGNAKLVERLIKSKEVIIEFLENEKKSRMMMK